MPQVVPHKSDFPAAAIITSSDGQNQKTRFKVVLLGRGEGGNNRFAFLLTGECASYIPPCIGNFDQKLDGTDFSIWNTHGLEEYNNLLTSSFSQTDIVLLFGRNQSEVQEWASFYTSKGGDKHHDYYEITYEDIGGNVNINQVNVNKVDSPAEITTSSPQFELSFQGQETAALATANELLKSLRSEALGEESTSSCVIL